MSNVTVCWWLNHVPFPAQFVEGQNIHQGLEPLSLAAPEMNYFKIWTSRNNHHSNKDIKKRLHKKRLQPLLLDYILLSLHSLLHFIRIVTGQCL